jgi:hypothetical protein
LKKNVAIKFSYWCTNDDIDINLKNSKNVNIDIFLLIS